MPSKIKKRKKKPKLRIPVPPPNKVHKTAKDYKRKKKVAYRDYDEDT